MTLRTIIPLVAVILIAADVPAQEKYTSKKDGFSISVPSNFRQIPIRTGEKWILAKWQSKRPFYWTDPQGFSSEHKPMMRVLSFPHDVKNVKSEGTGDNKTKILEFPYRNYRDYLKRHHQGGGWFISKEQTLKIKGKEVTYLEVNVEKMTSTPKFTLVCIYELEHRDLAVEVDVLKNQLGKLKPRFLRALKSMKTFKPDGTKATGQGKAEAPGIIIIGTGEDLDKKYQERVKAWKKRVLEEAGQNLPKGWKKIDTKNYLVITHARPKDTKRFIDLAKAMRKWLDKNFKGIGQGKVSKSVIRICADSDEEMAYRSGSNDNFSWDTGEVVCSAGSFMGFEASYLARALTEQYMSDKNPALWRALPWWINTGLGNYVGKARVSKIKGFTFAPDPDDILRARKLLADKVSVKVQDLMTQTPEELMKGRENGLMDHATLSSLFVRFLLEGPGKKGKTKGLLVKTMTEAVAVLDGLDKDSWKSRVESKMRSKEPMTEAEEEEEWKKRKERAKEWSQASAERRKEFYKGIHDAMFQDWTAKDWSKLDKAFHKYLRTIAKR